MKPTYIGFLFLTCVYATPRNWWEPPEHEEEVIQLGLHFVYDNAFSDRALFEVNGSFDAYFTVLTRAAQEYFKLHDDPKIRLTLVGSSKLEEEDIIKNTTINGTDKLEAEETLDKLGAIMTWNETLERDVDIVFLATGKKLQIRESWRSGEWYGLSFPRSICFGNASVGLIHDDGATFNGVRLTALQVALLVGAKKDNGKWGECPEDEDQYLTSSSSGGRRPYLSDCSKASIRDFYYRVLDYRDLCWKDTPTPALAPEHNVFPVEFYKKFDCDACHVSEHLKNNTNKALNCSLSTINRNIDPWPSTKKSSWHRAAKRRGDKLYRRRTTTVSPYQDCTQSCCRFVRLEGRVGGYWNCWETRAADGTVCDSTRVCLDGVCA
ncbi:uncharacterized protein [Dermacentor andersoni]|uniref:uncharacterized protein isoform X2 n=1 Tax=Dermacentor andersoni TaxID=34620 RepID=UPI003B3B740A